VMRQSTRTMNLMIAAGLCGLVHAGEPSFTGLGHLPGGEKRSRAHDGSEGGSGRIGVSACREGGSGGKGSGRIGGFRLNQAARLGTVAT
jgi:hypothetical protein